MENASKRTRPGEQIAGAEPLPELAVSLFKGSDVRKFLQGYLTCDTELLRPGSTALPAALCNLKGRVVANGWAAAEDEDRVLIITHRSVAQRLREFLAKYQVFSKTEAEAYEPVAGLWGSVDNAHPEPASLRLDERRRVLFTPPEQSSASAASGKQFMTSLICDRRVLVQAATSETFLPQMLGLDHWGAVDFQKGCYLGQEVVARAQHRGQVKRRLIALAQSDTQAVPEPGATLQDSSGKTAGVVVQSVPLQADNADANILAVVSSQAFGLESELRLADLPHVSLRWID